MLCFSEVPKGQLLRVCGRKCCDAVACATCLDAWCAVRSPEQDGHSCMAQPAWNGMSPGPLKRPPSR